MSPHLAAEERLRRLAPLATAAAVAALILVRRPAPTDAGIASAALVALAAALVAHAVGCARGPAGAIAGAVAGLWLAAAASAFALPSPAAAAATAAAAAVAVALARSDGRRERPEAPSFLTATAAVAAVALEPRAWALAAVAAAMVAWRERGRARWLAAAPAVAALGGGALTLAAAVGHAPAWLPAWRPATAATWLADVVDGLGPVALVAGAAGVVLAAADRRARWTAAGVGAALAAALPLAAIPPGPALVGLALALGAALATIGARLGRPRHQALGALALAVLMVAPLALW
ncbi:MAG: hypothetical protein KJZ91_30920 [Myxococcales bacterium]|nr:hypothetical protein [Myxococcales bacterium]